MGMLSSTLFDKVQGGGYIAPDSESSKATEALADEFGQAPPNLVLLVEADRPIEDDEVATAATELVDQLKGEAGVTGVSSFWTDETPALRSADGRKGLIVASILGEEAEVDRRVGDIADRFEGTHGPVEVRIGGYAMLLRETVQQSEKDVVMGESIAFPITLIALLFVFGGLV